MRKFLVILAIICTLLIVIFGVSRCNEKMEQSVAMQQLAHACTNIVKYTGIPLEKDNAQLILYHSTLGGPFGDGDALYFLLIDEFDKDEFKKSLQNENSRWHQQQYSMAESQDLLRQYCSWDSFNVMYNFQGSFDFYFVDASNQYVDVTNNESYLNVRIAFYDEETGLLLFYLMDS